MLTRRMAHPPVWLRSSYLTVLFSTVRTNHPELTGNYSAFNEAVETQQERKELRIPKDLETTRVPSPDPAEIFLPRWWRLKRMRGLG